MKKVYLIEPTDISQNGTLRGKSLRAYEVTLSESKHKYGYNTVTPKSTGKMYIIKDGKVVCKNTKASLSNKYIQNSSQVYTTVNEGVGYWGCTVFADPHTALAAKHRAIMTRSNELLDTLRNSISTIEDTVSKIEDASFIAKDYPELFI